MPDKNGENDGPYGAFIATSPGLPRFIDKFNLIRRFLVYF